MLLIYTDTLKARRVVNGNGNPFVTFLGEIAFKWHGVDSLYQEQIDSIRSVAWEGKDTACIFATGGGKSLVILVSAYIRRLLTGKPTLIVIPSLALVEDHMMSAAREAPWLRVRTHIGGCSSQQVKASTIDIMGTNSQPWCLITSCTHHTVIIILFLCTVL